MIKALRFSFTILAANLRQLKTPYKLNLQDLEKAPLRRDNPSADKGLPPPKPPSPVDRPRWRGNLPKKRPQADIEDNSR
jgi:hypothetical protein